MCSMWGKRKFNAIDAPVDSSVEPVYSLLYRDGACKQRKMKSTRFPLQWVNKFVITQNQPIGLLNAN